MNIDLTGKKALIGGGSAGLGKAIAMQLAACGANIILVSHKEDRLLDTLHQLPKAKNQEHSFIIVNYTEFDNYQYIIKDFFRKNQIDILVNNTQGPPPGKISDKSIDDYQNAFDLLFKVNCFTTLQAIKGMAKKGWGRIINVSSMTVKEPAENLILSNTIRVSWQSWCKSLSETYAPKGITVNSILTGLFETDRIIQLTHIEAKKQKIPVEDALIQSISRIPMKRLGKPEEYAYLVAFLASDYASYLTGASIPLDGGMLRCL